MASNDFDSVISTINQDLQDHKGSTDSSVPADDNTLIISAAKDDERQFKEYNKRDYLYTHLLNDYIKINNNKFKWNRIYKLIFYIFTMLMFVSIIVAFCIAIVYVFNKTNVNNNDAVALISGASSVLTAIIVLPKVIAKHLFPENEDEKMIEMVKNMQINDSQIRNYIQNTKSNEKNDKNK